MISLLSRELSKASVLQRSVFFMVQLSHPYRTAGKALTIFCLIFQLCLRQINWHPIYRDEVTVLPTYTLKKLKSQYSNLCLCHSNTQDFNLSETGSRCYLPSCHQPCHQPQGKAIGDSFHKDRNSKTSIVGQLREEAGSYPDTDFLFSQSRELPDHSSAEKVPWRSKRSYVEGCSLSMCLFCKVHLG